MATNQEKINQLNLTKQRINETSNIVRAQIDNGAIPILNPVENANTIKIVKDARQYYNERTRDTKFKVDEAIQTLMPNPIIKLPMELTYNGSSHKQVTGLLLPEILFINTISDEEWIALLNWIVKNQYFNCIRCFSWGGWELESWKRILKPFIQLSNGKFDIFQNNPEFHEMVDRRLAAAAERRITIILTMVDNCSFHSNTGAWGRSYWNGKNNINGTSDWDEMVYHYYEPEHQTKPGWKQTKEAFEGWVRLMLTRYMKYWPYLIIEQLNEGIAAQGYHKIYSDILNEFKPSGYDNFPMRFKQSSVGIKEWYKEKRLEDLFMMSLHGIQTIADYEDALKNIVKPKKKYIFSGDGKEPATPQETEDLTFRVLDDGHFGIEFNLGYFYDWQIHGFERLMSSEFSEWFEAMGRGLKRVLN